MENYISLKWFRNEAVENYLWRHRSKTFIFIEKEVSELDERKQNLLERLQSNLKELKEAQAVVPCSGVYAVISYACIDNLKHAKGPIISTEAVENCFCIGNSMCIDAIWLTLMCDASVTGCSERKEHC